MRFASRRGIWAAIGAAGAVALATASYFAAGPAFASPARGQSSAQSALSVSRELFGNATEPYTGKSTPVYRYTLTNANGMQVRILTFGGIIQSVNVPDSSGHSADVVLGFKTLQNYVDWDSPAPPGPSGPHFGETVGRYANRIAGGKFTLNGQTYTLPQNNNANTLHGGFAGFGDHIWSDTPVSGNGYVGVRLTLVSPDGDEGSKYEHTCGCTGFPGTVTVNVTYTLDNNNDLTLHYNATTDKPTVINLTNHSYFNLAGENTISAMNQKLYVNANEITPTDSQLIPTGAFESVKGTPYDFTNPQGTPIGTRVNEVNQQLQFGGGYDMNWVLNNSGPTKKGLHMAARASDRGSGRVLTVWTDQPGLQIYAGQGLIGSANTWGAGISNHYYWQGAGYTFETQHFPDSPNHPNFPSTELNPGQPFNTTTTFQFSVNQNG